MANASVFAGQQTGIPGGRHARVRTMAECEQIFDGLAAPRDGELNGVYRGRLAAFPAVGSIPGPIRRAVTVIATRLRFPWYGKGFDGTAGANIWLTSSGRFARYGYAVEYGQAAARLSYNRPGNPRLLRRLEAEVRALAPGRYLCRASRNGTVLLYFTLET